jgi:hypothetical protein
MAVIGYALLLGVADATNRTGDDTAAPFAGDVMVTPGIALTLPTVMLIPFVYACPLASHATNTTLCAPFVSARDVLRLLAFTV